MSRKNMTGRQFEEYCARYLRKYGFRRITVTRATGDQGADILARRHGRTYAIQCKLYQKPVGNSAVQEACAGKQYYDCDKGMVMTNSTFTKGARELADRTDIELWEEIPVRGSRTGKVLFALILLAALAAALYLSLQTVA